MTDTMSHNASLAFALEELRTAATRLRAEMDPVPPTDGLDLFIKRYCDRASMEDFAQFSAADAALSALELWRFGVSGDDDRRRIRIRDCKGADGRDMDRMVIEIVGPDSQFLVDSAISALIDAGVEIRGLTHPIAPFGGRDWSFIQVHCLPLNTARRKAVQDSLEKTYNDVRYATEDFAGMRAAMVEAGARVAALPSAPGRPLELIQEAAAFLEWLVDDNFIFLGAREYRYVRGDNGDFLAEEPDIIAESGRGVLRDAEQHVLSRGSEPAVITPRIRAFLEEPNPLIVAKSNMRSRVHRRVYADYVGVKRHDEATGAVIGETRFVGLFTSDAYNRMARDVPLLRRKVVQVKEMLEAEGEGYSSRMLTNVLETWPRDELFQTEPEDLSRIAQGVLALHQRPRTRLFIRRDRFDRYVSALFYTPRDSYSAELRSRVHAMLADAYGGRQSAYYPAFSDGPLARVHFIVGLTPGHPEPDEDALDIQVRQMAETWEEALSRETRRKGSPDIDIGTARFNAAYKEAFSPSEGLLDLSAIQAMAPSSDVTVRVNSDPTALGRPTCKIYRRDATLDLSDVVPVLENMGLKVRTEASYPIRFETAATRAVVYVHDLVVERSGGSALSDNFGEGFVAVWTGMTENDGFNKLIVQQALSWREAALLRTLCRYRSQTGMDPSETIQIEALSNHPEITETLVRMFAERFEPDAEASQGDREAALELLSQSVFKALEQVASLDQDKVLRRLTHLVMAVQRTNFYQTQPDGAPYPYISLKIASRELEDLPAPRPYREIFIWSPQVEGVHLRFGPIARGGLRWSDRRDDFRTEVLGLVKAQQVKNAVIVPVGAKGGFYPKQLPVDGAREDIREAGVAAYRTFISALLEITDNMTDGVVRRPADVVCWDQDDPYLVVAADKGTATFSDIANEISLEHGHWLGDAFASGGSAGYDHKKMGITARGAWEAVKRHFREMGKDIQSDTFSVIGVGDMSGDVFGNGMLLSRKIRLQAAFNHLHIFIDPDPNPDLSWKERKRLFDMGRSSWTDYDPELISAGGGIFSRSAKSIPLNKQIKRITGLEAESVTPDELIRAILRSDAELLWFGGIGTYIKSQNESHADVGDKANDALRIDARELSVAVIGEGANLGITQKGRIEFARHGGRANTDAIDNSAGVDSSDHEVNIKILLTEAIRRGDLPTGERNNLLADMTNDVAEHVLRNNYDQTGALSILEATSARDLDAYAELMTTLEAEDKLDRTVEDLPSISDIAHLQEQNKGLTRPEISVLMAYAKNDLFDAVVASQAPDDPVFQSLLLNYFPQDLARFDEARKTHRLHKEIISTRLTNRLVNMAGPCFPYQMRDTASVDVGALICASETARAVFQLDKLSSRIDALDNDAPAASQTLMQVELSGTLRQLTGAFVTQYQSGAGVGDLIKRYQAPIDSMGDTLDACLSEYVHARIAERAQRYIDAGAPETLAADVARLRIKATLKEAVDIAEETGWPVQSVTLLQHAIGERLALDELRAAARDLEQDGHWEQLAQQRVLEALPGQQAALTRLAVRHATADGVKPAKLDRDAALSSADAWLAPHQDARKRVATPALQFEKSGTWTLAKLVLVSDALRDFVQNLQDTV